MYADLTPEELELAERFGLLKHRKKTEKKVVVEETKVVKCIVECKLCKTVTTQYLVLVNRGNSVWEKKEEMSKIDAIHIDEVYETSVRLCTLCKQVLLSKEKEELVEMILHLCNPIITGVEVWNHIKKVKEDYDDK